MQLREARVLFTQFICRLVIEANENEGYDCVFGEGYELLTEKDPTSDHMPGSLHHIGLAQDLILYKNGKYCTDTKDYEWLGVLWESWGRLNNLPFFWGGRFKKPDGNHFSFGWDGKQ